MSMDKQCTSDSIMNLEPLDFEMIPFADVKLMEKIGAGTFGKVYLAEWNCKRYAVKKFRFSDMNKDLLQDIFKEAKFLMQSQSNYVVAYTGLTRNPTTNKVMLVMEYMEDGSLEKFIETSELLPKKDHIIQIALDVAQGLHHLHSLKILHRDLKSSNILLCESKTRAKLADFGTARILSTIVTSAVGTTYFMAPEARAELPYDEKADVYSFGVVLFHMCTKNILPYFAKREDQIARIKAEVPDPDFQEVIIACCAPETSQRVSAEQCINALLMMKEGHRAGLAAFTTTKQMQLNSSIPKEAHKHEGVDHKNLNNDEIAEQSAKESKVKVKINPEQSLHNKSCTMSYIRVKEVGNDQNQIIQLAKLLPGDHQLPGEAIYWFVTTSPVEIIYNDIEQFTWRPMTPFITKDSIIHYIYQIHFHYNKWAAISFRFSDNNVQNVICAPLLMTNSQQVTNESAIDPIYKRKALVANLCINMKPLAKQFLNNSILLFVPPKDEYVQMVTAALISIGFTKVEFCKSQLYIHQNFCNTVQHVFVSSYEESSSKIPIQDYLRYSSAATLLLENKADQEKDLSLVSQITRCPPPLSKFLFATTKNTCLDTVTIDYTMLDSSIISALSSVKDIQSLKINIASLKTSISKDQFVDLFQQCWLQWNLESTVHPSKIYLCFRYESSQHSTQSLTSLLDMLSIEEKVTVPGKYLLVYISCPSFVAWYILQLKDSIFIDGLNEVYEICISDVNELLQVTVDQEVIDKLTILKENMVADGIHEIPEFKRVCSQRMLLALTAITKLSNIIVDADAPELANDINAVIQEVDNMSLSEGELIECPPTVEKLPAYKQKVLEEKWAELKKFDNKWTKTVEECYNSDKLRQQLFNFKTGKNTKIAVRVFLSSASAGLATNVAKLMRQFRGKSIVDGVHAGLQIGNTIVEWNQSGIVHIGELKYGNAVAVLFDGQDTEVKLEFTEEIAQKWNTDRQYSTREFNSHRFVRDFLQYTMNVSFTKHFKGPLGSYMEHIMRTGDTTPRLISKTHGTIVFKTHKELEDKDRDIRDKLSMDELKLLKIFHRGFQLEEAANGQDVSSCYYGLPTNGLEILNDKRLDRIY